MLLTRKHQNKHRNKDKIQKTQTQANPKDTNTTMKTATFLKEFRRTTLDNKDKIQKTQSQEQTQNTQTQ